MPYFWHFFNNSAWMGGKGSGGGAGQQYIPYYVNGLFPLSFMVDDANLIGYVGRCYLRRAMHYTLAGTRKGLRVMAWVWGVW